MFVFPAPYVSVAAATIALTDNTVLGTDTSSYDFTTQSFGAATSADYIIIATGARATNPRTIDSVTIDGNAASIVQQVDFADGTNDHIAGIAIAQATGNSSGTVNVTFSGTCLRCGLGVYLVTNLLSTTATDTATDTGNSPSATLDISAAGIAAGIVFCANGPNAWTNLTERYDEEVESNYWHTGAADAFASAQSSLAISNDASTTAMVLASFR